MVEKLPETIKLNRRRDNLDHIYRVFDSTLALYGDLPSGEIVKRLSPKETGEFVAAFQAIIEIEDRQVELMEIPYYVEVLRFLTGEIAHVHIKKLIQEKIKAYNRIIRDEANSLDNFINLVQHLMATPYIHATNISATYPYYIISAAPVPKITKTETRFRTIRGEPEDYEVTTQVLDKNFQSKQQQTIQALGSYRNQMKPHFQNLITAEMLRKSLSEYLSATYQNLDNISAIKAESLIDFDSTKAFEFLDHLVAFRKNIDDQS